MTNIHKSAHGDPAIAFRYLKLAPVKGGEEDPTEPKRPEPQPEFDPMPEPEPIEPEHSR